MAIEAQFTNINEVLINAQ